MPPRAISSSNFVVAEVADGRQHGRAVSLDVAGGVEAGRRILSGEAIRSMRSTSAKKAWSWSAMSGCSSSSSWRLGTWPASTACM